MNAYKWVLAGSCSCPVRGLRWSKKQATNKHLNKMEKIIKNRVQLMGNLGKDPDVREFQGGKRLARLSVATNERFNFGDGQAKDDTQWHDVIAWGRTAEEVAKQLHKGSRVSLEGRLVHRVYETKEGQKRYITEVVMNSFEVIAAQAEELDTATAA